MKWSSVGQDWTSVVAGCLLLLPPVFRSLYGHRKRNAPYMGIKERASARETAGQPACELRGCWPQAAASAHVWLLQPAAKEPVGALAPTTCPAAAVSSYDNARCVGAEDLLLLLSLCTTMHSLPETSGTVTASLGLRTIERELLVEKLSLSLYDNTRALGASALPLLLLRGYLEGTEACGFA